MCLFLKKRVIWAVFLGHAVVACSSASEKSSDDEQMPEQITGTAPACAANLAAECQTVRDEIKRLEEDRDAAQARDDWATVARLSLAINQHHELLALLEEDKATDEARKGVISKYRALNKMLESDLKDAGGGGVEQVAGTVYHPLEVEAVAAVAKDFGDLYIDVTDPEANGGFRELKVNLPWSGYWYPLRGKDLFEPDQSPLKKFDRALEAMGRAPGAAAKEAEYHSLAQADGWEGLCAAWALASANTPEPTESRDIAGVTFDVLDQKALLTKIHERAPNKFYGIRYFGDAETDGTIQDLRPEAFHTIFQQMLGKQKKAFVIDDDPSVEVWSKPVYRVRWSVIQDPDRQDAFLVKAYPWMIRHRDGLSAEPTSLIDRASVVYEYRLFIDRSKKNEEGYRVIAGEWINESRDGHPDAAMIPIAGEPASLNPVINESMDLVRQIVTLP